MKPERWQRIEKIYYAALECDAKQRAVLLAEACGDDAVLRKEVEGLLAANDSADGFLIAPALELEAKNLAAEMPVARFGLQVEQQLSHYKILSRIGTGGMGEVYLAKDIRLDRNVAIKILPASLVDNPERLRRFAQEARATSALNHPNILTIYDIGNYQGIPFIVAELLEGAELRAYLREGALGVGKAIDYAQQIAQGLAAAHEKGIVHRDLKPENLFITTDGRLKILDFGLAKLTAQKFAEGVKSEVSTLPLLTNPGVVMGTVGYMSPEQLRGQELDHRSDIFSFGLVLHEMLTGQRTFQRENTAETIAAILKEEPREITAINHQVSPQLEHLVRHCLEKRPEERFQSVTPVALVSFQALADSYGVYNKRNRVNYKTFPSQPH